MWAAVSVPIWILIFIGACLFGSGILIGLSIGLLREIKAKHLKIMQQLKELNDDSGKHS